MTKNSTIIFMPCDYDDLTEITSLSESVLEQSYEDEDLNDELVGTLSEMSDKELSITRISVSPKATPHSS